MRDLEYLEEQNRQLRESLKACKLEVNKLRIGGEAVMLKPEQVPKEATEAAALQIFKGGTMPQAIAAALNAWPEMEMMEGEKLEFGGVFLPLPQEENPDA